MNSPSAMSDSRRDSEARCLSLVRRHGPRLLRYGGLCGVRGLQQRRPATSGERLRAIKSYGQTGRINETARRLGRSPEWVRRTLHAFGVHLVRPPGGQPGPRRTAP